MTDAALRRWQAVCIVAALVFVGLALAAATVGVMPGDQPLRDGILALVTPSLLSAARWVNYGGREAVLPAFVLILIVSPHARRRWWLWCAALIATACIETGFKRLVARARPEDPSMGFPSGHAAAAAAIALLVVYVVWRENVDERRRVAFYLVALAVVLAVGLARIVLRAHWPSDVVAGWAVGTAGVAGAAWWDLATTPRAMLSRAGPAPRAP
jgi:undecaprenyl-diphosphatase